MRARSSYTCKVEIAEINNEVLEIRGYKLLQSLYLRDNVLGREVYKAINCLNR